MKQFSVRPCLGFLIVITRIYRYRFSCSILLYPYSGGLTRSRFASRARDRIHDYDIIAVIPGPTAQQWGVKMCARHRESARFCARCGESKLNRIWTVYEGHRLRTARDGWAMPTNTNKRRASESNGRRACGEMIGMIGWRRQGMPGSRGQKRPSGTELELRPEMRSIMACSPRWQIDGETLCVDRRCVVTTEVGTYGQEQERNGGEKRVFELVEP